MNSTASHTKKQAYAYKSINIYKGSENLSPLAKENLWYLQKSKVYVNNIFFYKSKLKL